MNIRLNKTTWRTIGGVAASLGLVMSFQNCGKAGFDSNLDDSVSAAGVDAALTAKYGATLAPLVSAIPFAFNAQIDQITYNSCSEPGLDSAPGYYALKAGAYEPGIGGLQLSSGFFSYMDTNFQGVYDAVTNPNQILSVAQYEEYLGDSPANKDAAPNLSIRGRTNLSQILNLTGTPTAGTDIITVIGDLTDSLVMNSYVAKDPSTGAGPLISYFPLSTTRNMEATFMYNGNQNTAQSFRNYIGGSSQLALTYQADPADITSVRTPASTTTTTTAPTAVTMAYGRGYQFSFRPQTGIVYLPANIVAGVQEIDLSTGRAVSRGWNCSRVFQVFRVQDQGYCPSHSFADIANNPTIRRELEIAYRQLDPSKWDVNVSLRCAVPKTATSCYHEETLSNGVATGASYDPNADCINWSTSHFPAGGTNSCANYITICTAGF